MNKILQNFIANKALFLLIITISVLVVVSLFSLPVEAAPKTPGQLACEGANGTYDTATGACDTGGAQLIGAGGLVQRVINALIFIAGAVAVVMIIVGGIRYVISQGDQNNVTAAKNTILYAVIGLVIAFLAYALVGFITGSLSSGGNQQIQNQPNQQQQPSGSVTQPSQSLGN